VAAFVREKGHTDPSVTPEVESDDAVYLDADQTADFEEEAEGRGLPRLLIALVVLVVIALVGGWVVVRGALETDETAAVAVEPSPEPDAAPAPPPAAARPAQEVVEPEPTAAPAERAAPVEEPAAEAEVILPSFPCHRAESRVERLICSDAGLAALDRQLAGVYVKARRSVEGEDLEELKAAQRRWLRSRDACVDVPCVETRYGERLDALQADPSSSGE